MAAPRSPLPAASAAAGARPASLDPAQVSRQFARAASNAPATTSALMPFVEPDLCLALITPTPPQALGGTGQPTRQPR